MNSSENAILILTGSFGHGHNTAARNLEAAFRQAVPGETPIHVVDFFSERYPKVTGLLKRGYAFSINCAPWTWRYLYHSYDAEGGMLPYKTIQTHLTQFLNEQRPRIVVSTFPIYSKLMDRLYPQAEGRPFHYYTVVTDAITINTMWCRGNSDKIFVIDERSKEIVKELGVPDEDVVAHGFPMKAPPEVETTLSAPNDPRPRILYLPTTKTRHVVQTMAAMADWAKSEECEVTIVLGKQEARLRKHTMKLQESLSPDQLTLHGWIDNVPELMREHHVVITKAGGATINEALASQCPPLINYVVPGQEEGNAQLVKLQECGLQINAPSELPDALTFLLKKDNAKKWHDCRAQLKALDLAHASQRIVRTILETSG